MLNRYKKTRTNLQTRLQSQALKQKLTMLIMSINASKHERSLPALKAYHTSIPSMFKQYLIVLWTSLKSQYRSLFIIQIFVTLVAGFIIGGIQGSQWSALEFPSKISMAITCLTILSTIKHVDTFTNDALIMRRNIYNNVSITSYTTALMTVDLLWVVVMPLLFLVPYYYLIFPTMNFSIIYAFMLLSCMWASGLSYTVTQLPYISNFPIWSNLLCVFIVIILGVFFNGLTSPTLANSKGIIRFIHGLSYNRWCTEALSIYEYSSWESSMNNNIYAFVQRTGQCSNKIYSTSDSLVVAVLRSMNKTDDIKKLCSYVIRDAWMVLLGTSIAFRLLAFAVFQIKYIKLSWTLW